VADFGSPIDTASSVLLLFGPSQLDNIDFIHRYLQHDDTPQAAGVRLVLVGEVLWDRFPDSSRLGGAPLNVAVHLKRLGHNPLLVSAVGADALGEKAKQAITALGLDTRLLQSTDQHPTGSATVRFDAEGDTSFAIERPAAYDAVALSDATLGGIGSWDPAWIYYGTLFPSSAQPRSVLHRLLNAVPNAARFYDLNLRPGFESPALVDELLRLADVVKVNERELQFLHEHLHLPDEPEGFCRVGAERYAWRAACVTLGARGCVLRLGGAELAAAGFQVDVADPVGAGDAFAAALIHGIASDWPVASITRFANHAGAQVAATPGAIPDWSTEEAFPR
jgi:fructokinase